MFEFPFLAALDRTSSYSIGQAIGGGLFLILVSFGIFKCIKIMRRPTASSVCVCALLLLLFLWFLSGALNVLGNIFDLSSRVAMFIASAVTLIGAIAAVITGIVGLALYNRERFNQGRAQAIWAIVLGAILMMVHTFGIISGIVAVVKEQNAGTTVGPKAEGSKSGQMYTSEKFNCGVTLPDKWLSIRPERINPIACMAFRKGGFSSSFAVVIGEQVAGSIPVEMLADGAKANLAAATKVINQAEERVTVNGREFFRITTTADVDAVNQTAYYEHWLLVHHDYAWQIIVWAAAKNRAEVVQNARQFAENFVILDPDRKTNTIGTAQDVTHLAYGFSTDIKGLGWNEWTDAPNKLSKFSVIRLNEAMLIMPVPFEGESPDMEALTHGMMQPLGLSYASASQHDTVPWENPLGEGVQITMEHPVDGDMFQYILRIAKGKDHAVMIAGWSVVGRGDAEIVTQSMDRVELTLPIGKPVDDKNYQAHLSHVFNQIGLSYYSRSEGELAARWFEKAFHLNEADPQPLENIIEAMLLDEKHDEALALLRSNIDQYPKQASLHALHARLQLLADAPDTAADAFLNAISLGYKDEQGLLALVQQLLGGQHYKAAERIMDSWVSKNPNIKMKRWQAEVIAASNDYERALVKMEELYKANPKDKETAYTLAETCNQASEHARAAEVAEQLLSINPNDLRAMSALGWSQAGRKWYREAKATFEKIAQKDAKYPDIQDSILYVSALLGQGNNSTVKEPIELVAIPPELAAKLKHENELQTDSGRSAHQQLWVKGFDFKKGKPLRYSLHQQIKILNTQGVNEYSTLEFSFDPVTERVYMNKLEVRNPEGEIVATASVDDAYVMDAKGDMSVHEKTLHVQVPALQPGFSIDAIVTTERLANADTFEFDRNYFSESSNRAVFVKGDIGDVKVHLARAENIIQTLKTDEFQAWHANNLPQLKIESMSPPWDEQLPVLILSTDEGDWAAVGKEYLEQIKDRLQLDPEAKELAVSLTKDLSSDREKIAALARYVQKQISYKAIEFGVRARRPNSPSDTIKNRYGDCKDHSLLLCQLLEAIGIKSYLTLVHTYMTIDPAVPSLDQFNHVVVHVPTLGSHWLIDPTNKYLSLTDYSADYLWNTECLVLDGDQSRLLPRPTPAKDCIKMLSQRTITPASSDWEVEEKFTVSGYIAAWLRESFNGMEAEDQLRRAQELLSGMGEVQLKSFHFAALDDLKVPAVIEMKYVVRNAIRTHEGKATASIPAFWERNYLTIQFTPNRKNDFLVRYPWNIESEVTLNLPNPLLDAEKKNLTHQAETPYCHWLMKPLPAETGKTAAQKIHFQFHAEPARYPAEKFSEFHQSWEAVRHAWGKTFSWQE